MATEIKRDPDLEWLDHVRPVGLVVAPVLLKELGLPPTRQTQADTAQVAALIGDDETKPALQDPWPFMRDVLGWEAQHVAGSPGGPAVPGDLDVSLPEQSTTLSPTWAVKELGGTGRPWQLLVRVEPAGIDPDARGTQEGWEATAHQRFERLLRESNVFAGVLISERSERKDGADRFIPELRLVYAPKGETSGYASFPLRDLRRVPGRSMLGGLKLLLDSVRLFADSTDRRLPALLEKSREAQTAVSTELAGQVLGALHELLRGLDAAAPDLVRELTRERPAHLYEGLLTVLLRLVFVLYAEDRDLLPSRTDGRAQKLYESGYSLRGLYDRLTQDEALNPDTMDERRGAWGQLLALFKLIHSGHPSHFVQARGGKLFDPEQFRFFEGRAKETDEHRILPVSDGCVLRILQGLMTLAAKGGTRERLSYRTLDVEQIGSVYETVMGFRAELSKGRVLAIKAGKNNRTPVFVNLDALAKLKGKERIKHLKEEADRGQLSTTVAKAVETASDAAELAAALDAIADERGSPRKHAIAKGTPVLQPTDERRRTGSHYTPRSLTEPIVRYALEPAFERLGKNATPEHVLELKVCDPAMGSGAFLVEACRALAMRLVQTWVQHPDKRPKNIPPDEDEELHAKRLVAQRCLYGVDKNPLATDLAKLSLWLATLARDHEFTFLDHALKTGDSLVGLTQVQIAAAHWDTSKPSLPLFRKLVQDRAAEATKARAEIQGAPDDTARAIQEARHWSLEDRLKEIRLIGDGIVSAFFSEEKPTPREGKRAEVESWLGGSPVAWDKLTTTVATLRQGQQPVIPFHWEIEFPEVFARKNGGFDAIVGNPPFLGGRRISSEFGDAYVSWLSCARREVHGNADIVAHFFRRSFELVREGGALGLIATKTLGQGETRITGLKPILGSGGTIYRAVRRLRWPGEATVIVAIVHIARSVNVGSIQIDNRPVSRISAYLCEGTLDSSPERMATNADTAFQGSIILGRGFVFDDRAAEKAQGPSLESRGKLIAKDKKNRERIFSYLVGEDVNSDPRQQASRYVIDFGTLSLAAARQGWPDLVQILERYVKRERLKQKRRDLQERWWQFAYRKNRLYERIANLETVLVCSQATKYVVFSKVSSGQVFDQKVIVIARDDDATLCCLNSRVHTIWVSFFASTLGETLNYSTGLCFETFPFPGSAIRSANRLGSRLCDQRSDMMRRLDEGITQIYNRFHNEAEISADAKALRELQADMDHAVLEAYGWHDLAERAEPIFLDGTNEDDHTYQGRLFWPSDFRDEVLARLLALNAERHAEEVHLGTAPGMKGKGDDDDEDDA